MTSYLKRYDPERPDQVVMIGCANKNVHTFNDMVRQRLGYTGLLHIGDQVVVNENWLGGEHLVVKGETGIVREIHDALEKRAELEFVTATLEFRDPENQPLRVTTKVLLDTLRTPTGELAGEQIRNLKTDRMAKNSAYRANPHPANDAYAPCACAAGTASRATAPRAANGNTCCCIRGCPTTITATPTRPSPAPGRASRAGIRAIGGRTDLVYIWGKRKRTSYDNPDI